jgi:hypothetical protein
VIAESDKFQLELEKFSGFAGSGGNSVPNPTKKKRRENFGKLAVWWVTTRCAMRSGTPTSSQ